MKTYENARLAPVAAVVLAVCLTANLVAGFAEIEPRAARMAPTFARTGRAVASVVARAFDSACRVADDVDGDDGE